MLPATNQIELQRHKAIIFATIDYIVEITSNVMKVDGEDLSTSYYERLKIKKEKDFQRGRLQKLKKRLNAVIDIPRHRGDLNFGALIKRKTGFEIDIFENLQDRINSIIEQKKIKNTEEYHDVVVMLNLLKQKNSNDNVDTLKNLCREFNEKNKLKAPKESSYVPKEISSFKSPNEKFRLTISENENNGEYGMTIIDLSNKFGGTSIYDVQGLNLTIKAYWKNDNTVIIESKNEYKVFCKHKQVQFFDEIIDIKLIEN